MVTGIIAQGADRPRVRFGFRFRPAGRVDHPRHPDERRDRLRFMVVDGEEGDARNCRRFADFLRSDVTSRRRGWFLAYLGGFKDKCKCGVGFFERRLVGARPTTCAAAIGGPHDAEHNSTPSTTVRLCRISMAGCVKSLENRRKVLLRDDIGSNSRCCRRARCVTTAKS